MTRTPDLKHDSPAAPTVRRGDGARPAVAVCLASSFTGRTWHPEVRRLGSPFDRHRLESLRAEADLVLYGAQSVRTDLSRIELRLQDVADRFLRRTGKHIPDLAVVCRSADFDFGAPFWQSRAERVHLLLMGDGTAAVEAAPPNVEVHRVGGATMAEVLGALGARGYRRVLCEGGGRLFGLLAAEELVDEVFLTLTSWQLSGERAPLTMSGEVAPTALRLVSVQAVGDEVFLRYLVKGARPWLANQLA